MTLGTPQPSWFSHMTREQICLLLELRHHFGKEAADLAMRGFCPDMDTRGRAARIGRAHKSFRRLDWQCFVEGTEDGLVLHRVDGLLPVKIEPHNIETCVPRQHVERVKQILRNLAETKGESQC